jgi:DNA (cytosine-5)-methyltransferase 1
MTKHKFPYNWTLADAVFTKDKGKVFSCFACGGGSTMGYKLAGFDVLGCNEIDPRMAECYITNHKPKYAFIQPIQEFKLRDDLPADLYDLDILDGSPPCSSFSMAGNREKDWGKEKHFREGQAKQVLDTLFFDFIELAQKLKPKIVIAENVKGMLIGKAKAYTKKVYEAFDAAGYYVRIYLFNAAKMGVPQRRERIFFIALRKDIADANADIKKDKNGAPILEFGFNEPEIAFKDIKHEDKGKPCTWAVKWMWDKISFGSYSKLHPKGQYFGAIKVNPDDVCNTVVSNAGSALFDYKENRHLSKQQLCQVGSFPMDYNFINSEVKYLVGMSVPPIMTAQIATKIYEQWLSKINKQ